MIAIGSAITEEDIFDAYAGPGIERIREPDTELLINYQGRQAGIRPLIIGTEKNAARTQDHRIDHCRSWASAQLYSSGGHYAQSVSGWLADGMKRAWERIAEWRLESENPKASADV